MALIVCTIALAIVAPLVSRRLGWNWRPGRVALLWGVLLLVAASAVPKIAMMHGMMADDSAVDMRLIVTLSALLEAGGVLLVFAGVTLFRPLDAPA